MGIRVTPRASARRDAARVVVLTLISAAAVLPAAGGALAQARPLSAQRWSERAYGISMLPPMETTLLQTPTAEDYILRGSDERGGFTFSLQVKQSARILDMPIVIESVKRQMTGGRVLIVDGKPKAVANEMDMEMLGERAVVIDGHRGAILYAGGPDADNKPQLIAMAVMEIDPRTFGFLEFLAPLSDRESATATFEALVGSIQLTDPAKINAEREESLRRGTAWRSALKLGQLREALKGEQHYRILQEGKDIGYMRVKESRVAWQGRDGVSVELQSRLVEESAYADSFSQFFLADDDSVEVWTVTTTLRPIDRRSREQTLTETGLRSGGKIQVTADAKIGQHKATAEFDVPPGYLSQVESWLLPALLPVDAEVEYGFYSYNTQTRKMTYRTEKVLPLLDGFIITTRMGPNEPAWDATYDSNRRLVERQLGPKEKLVPAEPSEIMRVWAGRMAPAR